MLRAPVPQLSSKVCSSRLNRASCWGMPTCTAAWKYPPGRMPVGLASGHAIDMGMLGTLGFSHVPSYEAVESANLQDSTIWTLNGEETTVSIGLRQFDPDILALALGTGTHYGFDSGAESLITFGGKCTMTTRPLVIEATNVACGAPTSETVQSGITAIILTLYDTFCSSGLPWDDINAGALNELALEFQARPVTARTRGNRLGNMYFY
jgi:hypothetical protein